MAWEISYHPGVYWTLLFCFPFHYPFHLPSSGTIPCLIPFPSSVAFLCQFHVLIHSRSQSLSHCPVCPPHVRHGQCYCHHLPARFYVQQSRICPNLIVIIQANYLIPIQLSNDQEVLWLLPLAAWCHNVCTVIIATIPGRIHAHCCDRPLAGGLQIVPIDFIPKHTRVVPPPIPHLFLGFVTHLPNVWGECWQPHPKPPTAAHVIWLHQLELWKVGSRDWIQKDCFMQVVPCPLMLDATNIVCLYESTDEFRDESLYIVSIQRQP